MTDLVQAARAFEGSAPVKAWHGKPDLPSHDMDIKRSESASIHGREPNNLYRMHPFRDREPEMGEARGGKAYSMRSTGMVTEGTTREYIV